MSRVQYARPRSLAAAAQLLQDLGAGASVIAGGQELMPTINYGVFAPTVLVDVNCLPELAKIRDEGDAISIGALCVHREIERDGLVKTHAPMLAHALSQVGGGWQVRNRGTIGGNIVSAHPLYDAVPALLTLGARVQVQTGNQQRVDDLVKIVHDPKHGLGTTAILCRIVVPKSTRPTGWGYEKLKSTHGAYASATSAAAVSLDDKGRIAQARLTIGAVEQLPLDVSGSLAQFEGEIVSESVLAKVETLCAGVVTKPLSDQRGDAEYRRAMAGVTARRAFEAAAARARSLAQF